MNARRVQRDFFLASRSVGDYDAARRGRLGERLLRRQVTRRLVGPAVSAAFRAIFR